MTVETATTQVLRFFASCVVCVLYGDCSAGCRGEVGRGVVMVGVDGVSGIPELGGDNQGGIFEFDSLVGRLRLMIHRGTEVIEMGGGVLLELVVSDIGESGATDDGAGVVVGTEVEVLLVLVPFVVVGLVVDEVVVWLVVQLLEERRGLCIAGLGVDGDVVEHQRLGIMEEGGFGDRVMFEADEHVRG